jgi:hypothetical protein
LFKRLRDPATREKIAVEVRTPSDKWENLYLAAGSPDKILLSGFKSEKLKPLTGKSLAEIAKMRGKDPVETVMDLISEDESRIDTIYFLMSEENVKKEIAKPWVSFGSDEASQAPEGNFLKSNCHPRAYGNFARVLGKYVREEKILTLEDAVRKLSGLPATNLGLDHRGFVQEGMFADVVVFDPATVGDRATFEKPHQYSVGMKHVFVNGAQVLKDGEDRLETLRNLAFSDLTSATKMTTTLTAPSNGADFTIGKVTETVTLTNYPSGTPAVTFTRTPGLSVAPSAAWSGGSSFPATATMVKANVKYSWTMTLGQRPRSEETETIISDGVKR